MDKRKLIGTIIGVTMFGLLIVGATYAWLTFAATVTNGTYSGTTEEFVINYTGDTGISESLPILSAPTTTNVTKHVTVSAYKTANSSTGTLYLKLTSSTTDTLTTGGVIRYAVCSGTASASSCSGSLATKSGSVLEVGSVTKTGEIVLYTTAVPETQTYYWIYFWMDAATIQNSHLGQSYSGYIHASAQQTE